MGYKVKLATVVEGDPKVPFSLAATAMCRGGCYFFHWIVPLTFHPYLIMLSVKQGGIKHHFLSLWYDSTWDWTPIFQLIGEHSTHPHRTSIWRIVSQDSLFLKKKIISKIGLVWLGLIYITAYQPFMWFWYQNL